MSTDRIQYRDKNGDFIYCGSYVKLICPSSYLGNRIFKVLRIYEVKLNPNSGLTRITFHLRTIGKKQFIKLYACQFTLATDDEVMLYMLEG